MTEIDLSTIPPLTPGEGLHYCVVTAVSALRGHISTAPHGETAELIQKIGYIADFLQAAADMFEEKTSREGAV